MHDRPPRKIIWHPFEPRFDCPVCGPTNHFMGITTNGKERRFCVVCNQDLAQEAAMMPHTKS